MAKITHQGEIDKAPGKGHFLGVPLPCVREVAAPPCYQHRSWEPVRRPEGSVSRRVVNWDHDFVIATNSSDTGPSRMRSRSSSSPLDMQLILQLYTHVYFQVTCANVH